MSFLVINTKATYTNNKSKIYKTLKGAEKHAQKLNKINNTNIFKFIEVIEI